MKKTIKRLKWKMKRVIPLLLVATLICSSFIIKNINSNSYAMVASELRLGDIVVLGKLGDTTLEWRVCGFGPDCAGTTSADGAPFLILDNWSSSSLSDYGGICFDAEHTGDIVSNRNTYGSNIWQDSTIRVWLNTDEEGTNDEIYNHTYYSGGNPYSIKDSYGLPIAKMNGFLYEFTDDEKSALLEVEHKNLVNRYDVSNGGSSAFNFDPFGFDNPKDPKSVVSKNNYNQAYYQNTSDKVFLLNLKELVNAITNAETSNFISASSGRWYWTRDAYGDSHYELLLNDYNNVGIQEAHVTTTNYRVRPAVLLSTDQQLEETADGKYQLPRPVDMSDVTITGIEDKVYTGLPNYQIKPEIVKAETLGLGDIVSFGRLGEQELKWRVCGFGTDCEGTTSADGAPYLVLDNWLDPGLDSYAGMVYDPPHNEDSEPSAKRKASGSSNWRFSTIKTWLNSDLTEGINYNHDHYTNGDPYNKSGFLSDFTEEEKSAILDTTHNNIVFQSVDPKDGGTTNHTSNTGVPSEAITNYDDAWYQTTTDKVFLMNIKELNNAVINSSSSEFSYFDNSSVWYFLRDELATGINNVHHVRNVGYGGSEGNVNSTYANNSRDDCRLRPAFMISLSQSLVKISTGNYKMPGANDGYFVRYNGNLLEEAASSEASTGDYYVTYSEDVVNAGEVEVTFYGMGKYTGQITKTYDINPAEITIDASGFEGLSKEYDGDDDAKVSGSTSISKQIAGVNGELLNYTLTGKYDSQDASTSANKTVTYALSSFDSVTGGKGDCNNYTLTLDSDKSSTSNNSITPKTITIDLSSEVASKEYDKDANVKWSGSSTKSLEADGLNSEKISYTISGTYNDANAGENKTVTYTINTNSISVSNDGKASNYNLQIESNKNTNSNSKITVKTISESDFTINTEDETFTGSNITKEITSSTLTLSTDYKVEYSNNKNVGDATITITGLGNYDGTITKTFKIASKAISEADFTISDLNDEIYTGSEIKKTITSSLTLNTDYEIIYSDNTNVGEATITIKGLNDFSGQIKKHFNIKPKTLNASDFTYKNIDLENPDFTIELMKKSDYTNVISDTSSIVLEYNGDLNVKVTCSSATFKGVTSTFDEAKLNIPLDVTINNLSINNTNYVLDESFTSFDITGEGKIIDAIKPSLVSSWITIDESTSYKVGDVIKITLNFDKKLASTSTGESSKPVLKFTLKDGGVLDKGNAEVSAVFKNIDTDDRTKAIFEYTVKEGDYIPNGTTLKLALINHYDRLVAFNNASVPIKVDENLEKQFVNLRVYSKEGIVDYLISLINNTSKSQGSKKQELMKFLQDNEATNLIFETLTDDDLISKIGESGNDTNRTKVADYVSKQVSHVSNLEDILTAFRRALEYIPPSGGGGGGGGGSSTPAKPEEPITLDEVVEHIAFINGYEDKTFKPNNPMTRAEFAKIIASINKDFKVEDYKDASKIIKPFGDIRDNYWYTPYIAFVIDKKIMIGYPEGGFKPEGLITRAEVSKVLGDLYEIPDKGITNSFLDVREDWYKNQVLELIRGGVIKGYDDGTFGPKRNITRAEFVALINRVNGNTPDREISKEMKDEFNKKFTDVKETDWFYLDILESSINHKGADLHQTIFDEEEKLLKEKIEAAKRKK